MIGKFQIQLGADQLTSGMSSSDFATDGALGVSCSGLNPYLTPGVMYPLSNASILSNIAGLVIASAEDSQSSAAYNRTFVDGSGNYYTYSAPSTVVKTNTATTNVAHYIQGKTDMVSFAGLTYVTTDNGDIDQWNTSGTPALTNSWWVSTKSQTAMSANAPHPEIVYNSFLYVADANKLNTIDSSGNIGPGVLTLNSNEIIYALGIDPVTGNMMVSVQTNINISDTLSSQFFVYLYDGISVKATRKIILDDLITTFHNVEGIVYTGSGPVLGQWNGNGVTFLRRLQNTTYAKDSLIYKHHMTSVNRILHVADGKQVLSYGTVINGKPKAFFYTANSTTTNTISAVFPMGSNTLGVAAATNTVSVWDFSGTGSGTAALYFNNIYFPRPVSISRIRIITTGITTAVGGVGNNFYMSEKEKTVQTANPQFIVTAAASPQYVFDFDYTNGIPVMAIQPVIGFDTQHFGIVRVYIYYNIAE